MTWKNWNKRFCFYFSCCINNHSAFRIALQHKKNEEKRFQNEEENTFYSPSIKTKAFLFCDVENSLPFFWGEGDLILLTETFFFQQGWVTYLFYPIPILQLYHDPKTKITRSTILDPHVDLPSTIKRNGFGRSPIEVPSFQLFNRKKYSCIHEMYATFWLAYIEYTW